MGNEVNGRFPKDCWHKQCPYFRLLYMGAGNLYCRCDLLDEECDSCDKDFSSVRCPISAGGSAPDNPKTRKGSMKMLLEGRNWHGIAREKGYKLCRYMKPGKYYLYQMFTTCFVEFDAMDDLLRFREEMKTIDPYWDYDPVTTINTNDPDDRNCWSSSMEEENRPMHDYS